MQESTAAKKDSGSGQDEGKDAYDALHEKTDWHLLFEKSRLWKQNIQIGRDEIADVLFQKINLKTDPSLLRVDIVLKDGATISPAFVSISRGVGFKIKNLKPGEAIPRDIILKDNFLRITIPADPKLFVQEETTQVEKPAVKIPGDDITITKYLLRLSRSEILTIAGVSLLALFLLIGGLIFLR